MMSRRYDELTVDIVCATIAAYGNNPKSVPPNQEAIQDLIRATYATLCSLDSASPEEEA